MKTILIFIFLLFTYSGVLANPADTLSINNGDAKLINNTTFWQIEDPAGKLTIDDVIDHGNFKVGKSALPIISITNHVLWVKVIVKNKSIESNVPVTAGSTIIDDFDIYYQPYGKRKITHLKAEQPDSEISFFTPKETVINCPILTDSTQVLYIRIQSSSPSIIPIQFYADKQYDQNHNIRNTQFGIFAGIVLIMIFYNLFLFFIVHDKSYLYYVVYVIFFSLTQSLLRGYGHYYMNASLLNNYINPLVRVLFWISILLFINEFLQIKNQYHKIYKYYSLLYATTCIPLFFILSGLPNVAYTIISINASLTSCALLFLGIWLYWKGVKPAKFFMLAWSFFLISVLISVARNKDLIPYNSFTSNALLFGAVAELVLFSIALADKINFYRDENNKSQSLALKIAKENEKLITGQNIQLETKVLDRTKELLESNKNLMGLVTDLKAAQSQLIETEKMASLGQLTAGIAHEINNPINFVKSNIKPLRLDFKDIFEVLDQYALIEQQSSDNQFEDAISLKKRIDLDFVRNEITDLLNGIEEGATRTAEIVQSLRDFSRTDEVELKPADINRGILSSLTLLRNIIPYYIEITPVFDKLSPVNCYPGKLNQVFINLIHNSIQAIIEKKKHDKERILIQTRDYPKKISIEITDTGIGMTEDIKQKMFDPFFTTKAVGEGTGLGLSIVFGIIEKHKGAIEVTSKYGEGTTITMMIPKTLV